MHKKIQKGKFQKLFLSLALLSALVLGKKDPLKNRAANFFPRGTGAVLNISPEEFDKIMATEDHLMFVYVFDSEQQKSKQLTEMIINPLLEELKGYFKLIAFDCNEEEVAKSSKFKQICEKEEYKPFFQLIKPAEMKINPYTKQPMQPQSIAYDSNEVSQPKVKSFILNNLPNFATKLDKVDKLEEFRNLQTESDINRVILFSKKANTPPIYKVLTSSFREKFRFGFVSQETPEVVELFKEHVSEFPTILVLKSYDSETNQTSQQAEIIKYNKKEYKLDELKDFLTQYSRKERKEELPKKSSTTSDDTSKSNTKKKKPYAELYNDRHFNTHILDNEKAALVFFITGPNVTADVPQFEKIFKQTHGPLQIGVYYLNESAPEFNDLKKQYKLGNKFPQLRFYKNNIFGDEKRQKSHEIYLTSKIDTIIDEIHDGMDHEVRETSEKILMNMATQFVVEQKKTVVFYFYDEGQVSLHIKALSALPVLRDSFVFISVSSPSEQMREQMQLKQLPAMAGVLPPASDKEDGMRQFAYGGNIEFNEILDNLLKLSGKEEEYYQLQKNRKLGQDRKFEEITDQQQFKKNCLDRQKGCAIAFLNGNQILDYEIENHKEYLSILESLEQDAKTLPIYYMWINASCHSYLLPQFDVNPMFVPTVVFYLPDKEKSAHLIGKFDKSTIQKHEQKFAKGQLATFSMKTKASEIVIQDLDCPNMQPEVAVEGTDEKDKELEDEILKEILREDEERRKQRAKEEADLKKKGKKGGKGKKKGAKKDDL